MAYLWRKRLSVLVILLVLVMFGMPACDRSRLPSRPNPDAKLEGDSSPGRIAGSTVKAKFRMVTDQSSDSGASWTTDDAIRFGRVIDGQRFVGELEPGSGKIDLKPIGVPDGKGMNFYWSPRGAYLFLSQVLEKPGLWLYDTETGKATSIPYPGLDASDVFDIAWAPDESSAFALVSRERIPAGDPAEYPKKLVRIDPFTGASVKVADLPGLSHRLALSPAGDMMLVSRLRQAGRSESFRLFSVEMSSGQVEETSLLGYGRPKWTPDAGAFAYASTGTAKDERDGELWIASSRLSGARVIAGVKMATGLEDFVWLPDGEHLLLGNMTIVDAKSGEIKKLELSGEKPVEPYRRLGPPSWDGKKVLLESDKGLGIIVIGE